VDGLTREELAERAGAAPSYIERLVDLGIVQPISESAKPFSLGDVRRVRFVRHLDEGGLILDGLGRAIRAGDLSLAFLDTSAWQRFGGLVNATYADVSARREIPLTLLQSIREAMGFARPSRDERLREDELPLVEWTKAALDAGADPAAIEHVLHVWGEGARHIAEAGTDWFHAQFELPLVRAGLSDAEAMSKASNAASRVGALVDGVVAALYHAQSEHTWIANKIESVEATLERFGAPRTAHPSAMCFVDVAGYTRLTEVEGDAAAADVASRLGDLVRSSAVGHRGRPVKWLGDGVMLFFADPSGAVPCALDIVEAIPTRGLPAAHIGIAAGPIVFQDGDYFGRTVNMAARIAAHAGAGQVVVTDEVRQVTADAGVEFERIGPVALRGFVDPVELHLVRRSP